MSYHFLPYAYIPTQMSLMPPPITNWVAEGGLACYVSGVPYPIPGLPESRGA